MEKCVVNFNLVKKRPFLKRYFQRNETVERFFEEALLSTDASAEDAECPPLLALAEL